ncbi:MAG: tRNA (adenine-N1)-methyltransferase [Bifidobacterium tibiigranuli]|jgi:tRNA (adenine57-N1/adenine58-N1)-methyltransferase|nr:tRNA (adenine-N1)-methyltransferase [Bifidobacterium tibiigranuli]MCI1650126.1 tRNA (adenine-N1)-methyltransferase [Bifidobacterium tibiigranuli]MCI1673958.1 tRNA (adenine-N1)-methyltransferase [Bifidobacterium tibiigranuli]MCI1714070.1 tRNA (adenine-N1)-methyltransferase [Bifidobacterium tibiigranuli]MCI1833459.1 tRNA (adenine-N1)-methyltransferase [Bifidobacterium tibiigranuli]MCI2185481.1 tRNA (adenine-N1)-methyltransferase [Bifidobacterium tibiigranuli]
MPKRGALQAGEKVQFTDRKSKRITAQLVAGGTTQTEHGLILHDDVIGGTEGVIVTTVHAKRQAETEMEADSGQAVQTAQSSQSVPSSRDAAKPWKAARAIGGWQYAVMRPRLADYVLSMPRGAQIMYPKDIAQVIQLGDICKGLNVLESGAGSGAMSLNLLDAVGEQGRLTTIEMRGEFAKIAQANATLYFGGRPAWWDLKVGDFDSVAADLPAHSFDRIVLDMLDPWNRLEQAHRIIAPGGVLVAYITTTTQLSRLAEALREAGVWTEPEIQETLERDWKAQGLAVRPDHQMIGHTGFLVISRAMAEGFEALRKRDRATKDTHTDIDAMSEEERAAQLEDLELRDISDRKLRKVLRDLDAQVGALES